MYIMVLLLALARPPVDQGLSSLLSRQQYEQLFPHHNAIYTYDALLRAAASFPSFAGEGSREVRIRELAAFFAHAAHEYLNDPF